MKKKSFLFLATLIFIQIAYSNQSVLIENNSSKQIIVSLEVEESDIQGDNTLNTLYEQMVIGPKDKGVLILQRSRLAGWEVNINDLEYLKLYDAKSNLENEVIIKHWWKSSNMPIDIPQEIPIISSMYANGIDSVNKLSAIKDKQSKNRVGVAYQVLRLIGDGQIQELSQALEQRSIKMKDFSILVKNHETGRFIIEDSNSGLIVQAISSQSSGKKMSITEIKDILNFKDTILDPKHHGLNCQIL